MKVRLITIAMMALLLTAIISLSGCKGDNMTGSTVIDTERMATDIGTQSQLTNAGKLRVMKKGICDNTYDDARVKKCYKAFGVDQIIGADVANDLEE